MSFSFTRGENNTNRKADFVVQYSQPNLSLEREVRIKGLALLN